jgi:hypothetical protein
MPKHSKCNSTRRATLAKLCRTCPLIQKDGQLHIMLGDSARYLRRGGCAVPCPSAVNGANDSAQDEESRLLFDDPSGVHYGSFGEQQVGGGDDPIEVQREIEALQRVVARTSE